MRYLLVDDNAVFRGRLASALEARGATVAQAGDYEEALAALAQASPDRAVVDLRMPGESGLALIRAITERSPETRVLMLTGYGSIATAVDAVRMGAVNYLSKPADADMILAAFERGAAPALEAPEVEYEAPSLARAEWEHINRVLTDCDGNISRAARILGLHRRTLQRKLQKYPPRS